ncbi:MAG: SAM-dependent methyltransferase [Spirochaetota bacterium]
MTKTGGILYLIPNLIAPGPVEDALPTSSLARIRKLSRFVVEGEKAAWKLLAAILDGPSLAKVSMELLDEHTKPESLPDLLAPAIAGEDLGLISEAGIPCIADPGAPLVALAHDKGLRVVPLVGPSSLFLALAASGLDGQRWMFLGYLPAERNARREAIRAMERDLRADRYTRIFIETPYRNDHLLMDCLECLGPGTRLCVALAIGTEDELIQTATVGEWRKRSVKLGKRPCVFLLGMVPPLGLDRTFTLGNSRSTTCSDKKS